MQNILITGANRGIGLELTRQYLSRGGYVWGSYRELKNSQELVALSKESENLSIFPLDVAHPHSVANAFATLKSQGVKIELLFNNAGIIDWNNFQNVTPQAFDDVYRVNVTGAFSVIKHAQEILHIGEGKMSRIINLSSRLGSIELRGNTQLGGALAYQCSKAALNMLSKQCAIDLSEKSISVISMSPGWVKTDMGGSEAKYEVEESVTLILRTLDKLDEHITGIFIGEDGQEIPW